MTQTRRLLCLPWSHVSPRTPASSRRSSFRPGVESLEDRTTPAVISWTGAGSDNLWSNADNWDLDRTPDAGDDVVIDIKGKPTIVYSSGDTTVHSIASKESLHITGGSLSATDGFIVQRAKFTFGGGSLGSPVTLSNARLVIDSTAAASFVFQGAENYLSGNVSADQTVIVRARNIQNGLAMVGVKKDTLVTGTVKLESDTPAFSTMAGLVVRPGKTLTLDAAGTLHTQTSGQGMTFVHGNFESAGTIEVPGDLMVMNLRQTAGQIEVGEDGMFSVAEGTYHFDGGSIDGQAFLYNVALSIGEDSTGAADFVFLDTNNRLAGNIAASQSVTVQAINQLNGHAYVTASGAFVNSGKIHIASSQLGFSSHAGLGLQNGVLTNVTGGEILFSGGSGFLEADIHNGGLIRLESSGKMGDRGGSTENINEGFIQILNNSTLAWDAVNPVNEASGVISGLGELSINGSTPINHGVIDLVNPNNDADPGSPAVVEVERLESSIRVVFTGATMNESTVTDLANYEVKATGPDHLFGQGDDEVLAPSSITYDAATRTAVLNFGTPLPAGNLHLKLRSGNIKAAPPLNKPLLSQVVPMDYDFLLQGASPPALLFDLDTASDLGASSSDNITNQSVLNFNIAVSQPGDVELDWTGDGKADWEMTVAVPRTIAVTTPTLPDGARPATASFHPHSGEASVVSGFDLTVDTHGPRLLKNPGRSLTPIGSRDIIFSEAIDAATFGTSDVVVRQPDGSKPAITGVTGAGASWTVSFAPSSAWGVYQLDVAPDIRDLAGNSMDQDRDGIQGESVQDVGGNRFFANLSPVLDNSGVMQLPQLSQSAVQNDGVRVRDLIASAGGDRITDADPDSQEGIAVIGVDNTHGRWQYSTDRGHTWRALKNTSAEKARLLAANGRTRVRFVPDAEFIGVVNPGMTFRAWDLTAGQSGGRFGITDVGGASPFSADIETASIDVTIL